ncbi:MAG: primosomal protein N', partial [Oscillospiraceae bacterium]|nr:primosomal protein N' [Oscillospiraceae bacterium]
MDTVKVAKIAVSAAVYAIDKPYSYKIPSSLEDKIVAGMRVSVPFGRGNRHVEGVVLTLDRQDDSEKLKFVEDALDDKPVIQPWQLKLALWMRYRFFCTVYDALKAMLPAGMWFRDGRRRVNDKTVDSAALLIPAEEALELARQKSRRAPAQAEILRRLSQIGEGSVPEITYFTGASRQSINALVKRGILELTKREVFRRPDIRVDASPPPVVLNPKQQEIYDGLLPSLKSGKPEAALLYGVTGSGKTSVYIRLVEQVLKMGRCAIILVPEIALTPQLMSLFASYFADDVAVLHSALGIGERYDEFKRISAGLVHVVVGTRSAVFAPVKNLGIIIMDEEHERTYKSENSPRYHARDVAKYRCVHENALLLLGSATPSVDSMTAAKNGKYKLFTLTDRYNNRHMPDVIISDMRRELRQGYDGSIGEALREEL